MELGKLSGSELSSMILDRLGKTRPEVLLGAQIGEDTCAVRTPDLIVLSTDPITAVDKHAGFLAIHVNANDIAASGAEPFAALVTIMVPPQATENDIETLANEIFETATSMKIDVIGGHTEVTDAVTHSIVSVTMMGLPVVPGHIVQTSGMRTDDTIIMTKYAGIEGTMILADRYADQLRQQLDEEDRRQLALLPSFISVVPEGAAAAKDQHVSAMHDITEGGVVGALQEMCTASNVGAVIDLNRVPILPVTRKICALLKVDPVRIMSSGSMLIAVSDQSRLMEDLADQGIPATVIGHASPDPGVRDKETGELLAEQSSDALYSAATKGGSSK